MWTKNKWQKYLKQRDEAVLLSPYSWHLRYWHPFDKKSSPMLEITRESLRQNQRQYFVRIEFEQNGHFTWRRYFLFNFNSAYLTCIAKKIKSYEGVWYIITNVFFQTTQKRAFFFFFLILFFENSILILQKNISCFINHFDFEFHHKTTLKKYSKNIVNHNDVGKCFQDN